MIGTFVENYKIVSQLGEGGMGVVYKALDTKLERFAAIKILKIQGVQNPQFVERFKREAKNQAKLNHPNIIPVYGFVDDRGVLGIAMEYVEGETLEELIMRTGRLNLSDAVYIIKQVLAGVAYAHTQGFVHRDIKPSNIIINSDGVCKIMDFGISKSMFERSLTKTGTKIGTILYMSPEQIRAEEPNQSSDIYSIGITFYEMLVGLTPFEYKTEYEIMEGHLKRPVPKINMSLPSIPHAIDKVIEKACAKDPVVRYPACDAFLEDLEEIDPEVNKQSEQKGSAVRKKSQKVSKKNPATQKIKLVAVGLMVVGLVVAIAYSLIGMIQDFWPSLYMKEREGRIDTTYSFRANPHFVSNANWTELTRAGDQTINGLHAVDANTIYACGDSTSLWRSTNGGITWDTLSVPDSSFFKLHDIAFADYNTGFTVGEGGRIFKTTDGGDNWSALESATTGSLWSIHIDDQEKVFAAGAGGLLLKTVDGGRSWQRIQVPVDDLLYTVYFVNHSTGFAVGWKGTVLKTIDGGSNWTLIEKFTDSYLRCISFADTERGFVAGGGGMIYYTDDAGESWSDVEAPTNSGMAAGTFLDKQTALIVTNRGEVLRSDNGGEDWEMQALSGLAPFSDIAATQSGAVYAAGIDGFITSIK